MTRAGAVLSCDLQASGHVIEWGSTARYPLSLVPLLRNGLISPLVIR